MKSSNRIRQEIARPQNEINDLLSKIAAMPPILGRATGIFIFSMSSGDDFIWKALPILLKLNTRENQKLKKSIEKSALLMRQTGQKKLAEKLSFWAHELMVLDLYRNEPASIKLVFQCHVPAASRSN
jgi:hypothetical protein